MFQVGMPYSKFSSFKMSLAFHDLQKLFVIERTSHEIVKVEQFP